MFEDNEPEGTQVLNDMIANVEIKREAKATKRSINDIVKARKEKALKLKEAIVKVIENVMNYTFEIFLRKDFNKAMANAYLGEAFSLEAFANSYSGMLLSKYRINLDPIYISEINDLLIKYNFKIINLSKYSLESSQNGSNYLNYYDGDKMRFIEVKAYDHNTEITIHFPTKDKLIIDSLIKELLPFKAEQDKIELKATEKFNILLRNGGYFSKHGINIPESKYTIEELYNDDIIESVNSMVEILDDKANGLFLLQGEPGTGKTNMLYEMTKRLERDVIFIPSNDIMMLSDSAFLPFLIRNQNAVIVIEDAGSTIRDRKKHPESAVLVETVLNLTAGFLATAINCALVLSVNEEIKDLDSAIVRNGRMQKIIEFDKLGVDKSNALLTKLESTEAVTTPQTIANLFALKPVLKEDKKNKIGF